MIRKDIIDLFRVPVGKKVRLKDHNPGWKQSEEFEDFGKDALKERAKQILDQNLARPRGGPEPALRRRPLRGADRPPGDGRGRQGRHDQARHERREPAGLPGVQLQEAVGGGTRPQLPLAVHAVPAGARPDRHLQPVVLRGRAGGEGPPRVARPATPAREGEGREEVLGGAVRGHQRLRAAPRPQRDRDPQVLPERLEGRAEAAVPGAARPAGEELEVLAVGPGRAGLLGRLHGRLRGRPRAPRAPSGPRGT